MKRTPKRIPETQKAIFTKSKSLDAIIIMMIIMLGLGSRDKRMTNSPWAVGTNGKFTESATFHNSARRQLSTNLAEGSREFGAKQARNSVRPVCRCRGRPEETPTGHPVLQFSLFPTLSQRRLTATPSQHQQQQQQQSENNKDRDKAKTKDRGRGKRRGETIKFLCACPSVTNYIIINCIYIIG